MSDDVFNIGGKFILLLMNRLIVFPQSNLNPRDVVVSPISSTTIILLALIIETVGSGYDPPFVNDGSSAKGMPRAIPKHDLPWMGSTCGVTTIDYFSDLTKSVRRGSGRGQVGVDR
jgi:hypothetical protein